MLNVPNTDNTDKTLKPYKDLEFEVFIREIGNPKLKNWSIYAKALDVDQDTITRWKKHPLARLAMLDAIQENLDEMSKYGKEDWKMYREKLKMLGIKDEDEHIVKSNIQNVSNILDKLEQTDYNGLKEKAEEALVQSNLKV